MSRKSLTLFIILSFFAGLKGVAQADISMATHWYNRANYNPASIVRTEYLYFFSNIRQQWTGVDGAPKVFNVQLSEYVHSLRSAFGLSLVGEKIGITQVYNPMFTYAYRISNEQNWSLALGLSAGVYNLLSNGSQFEAETPIDPAIPYGKDMYSQPDANVGAEFQSNNFIVALSSTHILTMNKSSSLYLNSNHIYGSVIYKSCTPEMFNYHIGFQAVKGYNLTVYEGNLSLRFKRETLLQSGPREIFDLGLTYRSTQQMTILFALNVSPNLRVGYAYDQSFISGYNANSTHELMLEYRIPSRIASTRGQFATQEYWYH